MKTVTVVMDSQIRTPFQYQRVTLGPDDYIVESVAELGDEYVMGDFGRIRPRRVLLTLREPTPEEDRREAEYWEDITAKNSRPWWRLGS